jgi:MFS family permease
MVLIAAFLGWLFDGFEMGLFPLIARPAVLDMIPGGGDATVGLWTGRFYALFLLGAAAGGLVFGWLGDRIGRVRSMSLSILTYSLFTALGYLARTPAELGALRFVAALGMGGEWSLGVALVMECWPERWRPLLAGAIGAAANVGFLLAGWIAKLREVRIDSWRWMLLVGAGPALLVFFIRIFVPESERWKASVREGPSRPLVEVFSPGLAWKTVLAIAFSSIALIGTWGTVQMLPLWADQMTERLPAAKASTQMASAFGAVVGCLLGPLLGGKIGRRPAFFTLCLLSLASCAYLYHFTSVYDGRFLALVFLVGCTTAAFYGWFPLYLPELFPTRVRATGQGVSYNFGRVFAAFGALTAGQLIGYFDGSYAKMGAVVSLIYALGLILIWLAPETRGKPLPK